MTTLEVPYFKIVTRAKGERYYFNLPKKYAASRLAGRLPDERHNAILEAQKRHELLKAWLRGEDKPVEGTVRWMVGKYQADARFTQLSDRTQYEYRAYFSELATKLGKFPADKVTRKVARALYEESQKKGLSRANAFMRRCRTLFNYGKDCGYVGDNPFAEMNLTGPKRRNIVWTQADIDAFLEACATMNASTIRLAFLLGLYTGQRQGDVLRLTWNDYSKGVIVLRQQKTGQMVSIPAAKSLRTVLDNTTRQGVYILLTPTGLPYTGEAHRRRFLRRFEEVKSEAVRQGMNPKCTYLDLRRTCAVRMALAGASEKEIAAVTGHRIESSRQILETYLPTVAGMAESAIAKVDASHE